MATGCHTCGGTLTGPVGTTREASKVTMVFETVSVCGARVPVPLVTKAPEAPPTAQSVVLNWPVILRVSSLCHAPASSMLPPVQARKRGRYPQNSSREAKIQNYRNSDIDRTVLGGCWNRCRSVKSYLTVAPQPFKRGSLYLSSYYPRKDSLA